MSHMFSVPDPQKLMRKDLYKVYIKCGTVEVLYHTINTPTAEQVTEYVTKYADGHTRDRVSQMMTLGFPNKQDWVKHYEFAGQAIGKVAVSTMPFVYYD